MTARQAGYALGRVAVVLGTVTAASRLVGLARTWVLSQTLGPSCVGTAYTTANSVPNLVFELVVGGALAASVVPLLAGALTRGERAHARRTLAALYGWVLLLLVPAGLVVALLAHPIVTVLMGDASGSGCATEAMRDASAAMLVVFAVQVPVYGLTVVAQGALQADHRFLAPAVAPLLSSVAMIGVYLTYARASGPSAGDVTSLDGSLLALLAWGTTAAVALLLVTQLPPSRRAGLFVRPALRFPEGVAARARSLATAGLVVLAAQWVAYAVLLRLVNDRGAEGAAVLLLLAWTVLLLPWAVLVYPLAIGSFPRLAASHDAGDETAFGSASSSLLRGSVLLAAFGGCVVVAVARPAAALLVLGAPGRASVEDLGAALTAWAGAVAGFALLSACGRVLYAAHRGAVASIVTGAGWLAASVLAVVLTTGAAQSSVVPLVGEATSVALLVTAVAAVAAVRAVTSGRGTAGVARSAVAALLGWLLAGTLGRAVASFIDVEGRLGAAVATLLAAATTMVVFAAITFMIDRPLVNVLRSSVERTIGGARRDRSRSIGG